MSSCCHSHNSECAEKVADLKHRFQWGLSKKIGAALHGLLELVSTIVLRVKNGIKEKGDCVVENHVIFSNSSWLERHGMTSVDIRIDARLIKSFIVVPSAELKHWRHFSGKISSITHRATVNYFYSC